MDEGEIGAGELVVTSGEAAMLFEPADQPLDDIALAIGTPVHQTRPRLGGELRDDCADAAAAQMLAHRPAGIATIGQQSSRPAARPTGTGALDRASRHQGLERHLLVPLASGQDEGDRSATALAAQVQLAAEAAPRAAERLIFLPPLAPAA